MQWYEGEARMTLLLELFHFMDDLMVSIILIVTTSIVHAMMLDKIMNVLASRSYLIQPSRKHHHFYKVAMAVVAILGIFMAITMHIWLWAFAYMILHLPELKTLEDAVYFSTVTFTTLGYGDLVLKDNWRVMSGIEAANGIVLLGWSTAFVLEVMGMIYPRPKIR